MKIKIDSIPSLGSLTLNEEIEPVSLDLDTPDIHFREPIMARHSVSRGTNVVSLDSTIEAKLSLTCCRCLCEYMQNFSKKFKFNFAIDKTTQFIDTTDSIREELFLSYPLKPLCRPDCKGLCSICGGNLNEGGCFCATT